MLAPLALALILSVSPPPAPADRDLAEQLARSGQTVEALALFERVAAANPADAEVRMWIALLQLRVGHTEEAEAGFRAVLREHPSNVDARIGLGATLTRQDAWSEALTVLHDTEKDAGQNADLFAAIARAYRRGGDDRHALAYYRRALALAPDNPELVEAYEGAMRVYGSSIAAEGFAEGGVSDARSVAVTATVRVLPRLEIEGLARVQNRDDASDALFGGGAIWRISRSTNLALRGAGGANNTSLAKGYVMAEPRHYRGAMEFGVNLRYVSYVDVHVAAASPILAWDRGGRWRLATRYTYSHSSFRTTGELSGDHSVLVRGTFRGWRRLSTTLGYAYGIESFEDLTADRIEDLNAHTVASTVQVRLPSLTSLAATWEHQWRPNDARLDRVTMVVVQGF